MKTKKFRHRLVVDVTTTNPTTEKEAAANLTNYLADAAHGTRPTTWGFSCVHPAKAFTKVFNSLRKHTA